ncbi:glutamate--tRNA ligase [Clostridiales bacterium COT073_COT-073]|nr:glutamate--tRNA ligase [Clostridiales bacterium COT073_COT-073]
MENKKIRTRFAPSPTGRMHVGNLRTALYAYLIAKHGGGDFLLRIEDTDQVRQMEGALEIIYRTMDFAGLKHDEGPDKDGGYGPYVQSDRQKAGIYLKYAKELVEKGEAYYCFCDEERLEKMKAEQEAEKGVYRYDKHCLHLSKEEIENNLKAGKPYVIRQNNPSEGTTTFSDVIFGDITVPNSELEDMILIKSDGYPTYNFANVVDDHLMEISHVVRGNEYLSSSPKYNRLYQAFGWEVPTYVHVPLITDENHQKLSKRLGHSSYEDLLEKGFLNEAIINFVALLGWSPKDENEILSLPELVEQFDYHQIKKSPAVFDMQKFRWLNSEYIKKLSDEEFYQKVEPMLKQYFAGQPELDLPFMAALAKTRVETLNDTTDLLAFFKEMPEFDPSIYTHKKMKTNPEVALDMLEKIEPVLETIADWSQENIHDTVMAYLQENEIKTGMMLWPLRIAVSGQESTPGGAFEILKILGKKEAIQRVKNSIARLRN